MKVFKKGDKVKVVKAVQNASQFNKGLHPLGVYSIPNWENKTFTIEGTIQLCSFDHSKDIYGGYLLSYEGNSVGYVYNDALEKAKEITYRCGEVINGYIIAQVRPSEVCLIKLEDGNRFSNPIEVNHPYKITEEEFNLMGGNDI